MQCLRTSVDELMFHVHKHEFCGKDLKSRARVSEPHCQDFVRPLEIAQVILIFF
jgi:hypothetical protein